MIEIYSKKFGNFKIEILDDERIIFSAKDFTEEYTYSEGELGKDKQKVADEFMKAARWLFELKMEGK